MFTFSKRTDYGLMALAHLAGEGEGEATSAKAIAARYGLPSELLAKTMQQLAKNGIVDSRNGPKGGYVLSRRPESISVVEIIEAIEGPVALAYCQTGDATNCDQFGTCPIVQPMERIQGKVIELLSNMTLLDMTNIPVGVSQ